MIADTGTSITAAGLATGDTIATSADVVTDFETGTDSIKVTSKAGGIVNLKGVGSSGVTALNANSVAYVRGDYSSGVFTVDTSSGADTLLVRNVAVITAGTALTYANLGTAANTSVTVLDNYTAFAAGDLA